MTELSNCMSLSAHRRHLSATRAVCWLEQSKRRSHTDIAAALVLMQAAQLLPRQTRDAAEPNAGPNAAATSADTDGNGRVCAGGLCLHALPPLLFATSEHQRPVAVHGL